MRILNILMFIVILVLLLSSCSRRITKRKGCNGKGGWYGNRNLSVIDSIRYNDITFYSLPVNTSHP